MKYMVRMFEVTLKNLYSQISKVRRKSLTLDDVASLKLLDPTSRMKKPEVAGAYLHWVIADYFNRFSNQSVQQYIEHEKDTLPLILKKYHSYRNRRLVASPDLATYTYEILIAEIAELEDEYGVDVYGFSVVNKDYSILEENSSFITYEAFTAEGIAFLGKFTTWCIAKKKVFLQDTPYRKEQGGKTLVIKFLNEQNSVPEYNTECEYYCVTVLPDHQIDEMVNANNESLFYTDKEEILRDLIKDYI